MAKTKLTEVERVKQLAAGGMSQREIARRLELGKGTVYGILKGEHGLSKGRAGEVRAHLDDRSQLETLPISAEKLKAFDLADARSRELARQYEDAVREYRRTGDDSKLELLEGKSVNIVGKKGSEKVKLITNRAELRELAVRGLIDDIGQHEEWGS